LSENNSFDNTASEAENIPHALIKLHEQVFLKENAMSHPTIPVKEKACPSDNAAQPKAPLPPKFFAELMKLLSQLVMLR
jgi:hypothetical protein